MIIGEKLNGGSSWSRGEDIAFENALAIYTDETENRWEKIARVVPGKTPEQIVEHYEILLHDIMMIESGCVHLPDYEILEETADEEIIILEGGINRKYEYKQECIPKPKQTRRRGLAWTDDEHSQFLIGLDKYGKGDWRSISRHFVVTRTPTQVASHAQKYFARLNSKNKNKKIRTVSTHDVDVGESSNNPTMQTPNTTQNTEAIQATSQAPQDHHPTHGTPTIWNTQATMYETPTMWNTQAALQPSVDIPHGTPQGRTQVTMPPVQNVSRSALGTPTEAQPIRTIIHDVDIGVSSYNSTMQRPNTQATWQPSQDHHPTHDTPTIWNTQATVYETPTMWNTQAALQPSVDIPHGTPQRRTQSTVSPVQNVSRSAPGTLTEAQPIITIIHDLDIGVSSNNSTMQRPNTQAIQATSQPSQDHHPTYDTPTMWNTQATMYRTPTMWNTQAASQPSMNIPPICGTPIVGQSMVGPMAVPFGSDMNPLAPPCMAYGVQRYHPIPYPSVPSAPFNMGPAPYNMAYIPTSR